MNYDDMVARVSDDNETWDVLIIGGGAGVVPALQLSQLFN